jgi:hypothetical protein
MSYLASAPEYLLPPRTAPRPKAALSVSRLDSHAPSRRVFNTPNHSSPHLIPIYAFIQLLVHQPNHRHVISSHNVESMLDFARWFFVVRRAYDALRCLPQDLRARQL